MRIDITDTVYIQISFGEYNYKELLEVLEKGNIDEDVFISTYNLSFNNSSLIDSLKKMQSRVKIITNIPGRFENYTTDSSREKAKKKIEYYFNVFKDDSEIIHLINLGLHGKMILIGNKIGYIGSANFSDESSNSIEIGVIIKDSNILKQMKEKFIPFIEEHKLTSSIVNFDDYWLEYNKTILVEIQQIETNLRNNWSKYIDSNIPLQYSCYQNLDELLKKNYEERWIYYHEYAKVGIPETTFEEQGYNPEYDCRCMLQDGISMHNNNDDFQKWASQTTYEILEYITMIKEGMKMTISTLENLINQKNILNNTK